MVNQAEDLIRETFQKLGDTLGIQIDIPDEMIANLAATLQTEIDRLEAAVEDESFSFLNELARAFRSGESNPRPSHFPVLEGIRAVLARLQSAGRLLTGDEMRLTAEQVAALKRLMDAQPDEVPQGYDLLEALFPATDPAEEVNEPRVWGIDASEPSDVRYVRDRYGCLFEKFADNVWHRWRAGVGRFGEADWTWSELASDLPVEVLGTPTELTPPAPAEPAEEETKAELPTKVGDRIRASVTRWSSALEWPEVNPYVDTFVLSSSGFWDAENDQFTVVPSCFSHIEVLEVLPSPVVPAPTETEWATVVEIPLGAAFRPAGYTGPSYIIKTALGYRITPNGDHRLWNGAPVGTLAPFVAAEEG